MGVIPRYNQRINKPMPQQQTSGAQMAIAAVGSGIDVFKQYKEAEAASYLAKNASQLEDEVDKFTQQAMIDYQGDLETGHNKINEFVNTRYKELSADANSFALPEFQKIKNSIEKDYGDRWQSYSKTQAIKNFNTDYDTSMRNIANVARRAGQRGEDVTPYIERVNAASAVGSTFIGSQDLNRLNTEAKAAIQQEWMEGKIETNPYAAQKELKSGKYDKTFSSNESQRLENLATGQIKAREAEAKRQEANAIKIKKQDSLARQNTVISSILYDETKTIDERTLAIRKELMDDSSAGFATKAISYLNQLGKKTDPKKVSNEQKSSTFNKLTNRLQAIRVEMGGTPDGADIGSMKINNKSMSLYNDYQLEVMDAYNKGEITSGERKSFIGNYSEGITSAIYGNEADSERWFGGISSPFNYAFTEVDKLLKSQGQENNLQLKKDFITQFSKELGEYKSTGNYAKDKAVVNEAYQAAIETVNREGNSNYNAQPKKANAIVGTDGVKMGGSKDADIKTTSKVTLPYEVRKQLSTGQYWRFYPDGRRELQK